MLSVGCIERFSCCLLSRHVEPVRVLKVQVQLRVRELAKGCPEVGFASRGEAALRDIQYRLRVCGPEVDVVYLPMDESDAPFVPPTAASEQLQDFNTYMSRPAERVGFRHRSSSRKRHDGMLNWLFGFTLSRRYRLGFSCGWTGREKLRVTQESRVPSRTFQNHPGQDELFRIEIGGEAETEGSWYFKRTTEISDCFHMFVLGCTRSLFDISLEQLHATGSELVSVIGFHGGIDEPGFSSSACKQPKRGRTGAPMIDADRGLRTWTNLSAKLWTVTLVGESGLREIEIQQVWTSVARY